MPRLDLSELTGITAPNRSSPVASSMEGCATPVIIDGEVTEEMAIARPFVFQNYTFDQVAESTEGSLMEDLCASIDPTAIGKTYAFVIAGQSREIRVAVSATTKRQCYLVSEVEARMPRLYRLFPVAGTLDIAHRSLVLNMTLFGPVGSKPEHFLLSKWLGECKNLWYFILRHRDTADITMSKCSKRINQHLYVLYCYFIVCAWLIFYFVRNTWVSHYDIPVDNKEALEVELQDFILHGKKRLLDVMGEESNCPSWIMKRKFDSPGANYNAGAIICHKNFDRGTVWELDSIDWEYFNEGWAYGELQFYYGVAVDIKGIASAM